MGNWATTKDAAELMKPEQTSCKSAAVEARVQLARLSTRRARGGINISKLPTCSREELVPQIIRAEHGVEQIRPH
jgi:hypothetical protein